MINYYRKFIKNFLKVAKPIIRLTKKEIIFNFRKKYKEAVTNQVTDEVARTGTPRSKGQYEEG